MPRKLFHQHQHWGEIYWSHKWMFCMTRFFFYTYFWIFGNLQRGHVFSWHLTGLVKNVQDGITGEMKALFQFIVFMPLLDLSNFFYWPTYICHNAWWVGDAKRWLHVIDRSLIPFVFEGRKTVTSSSQEASPSFDSITWGSRVSGADSLTHYPVLEQWHTSLKILFIYWISKHPSVYWNTVKSVSNTKQKHNFPLRWSLFFLDWQIHI